MDNIMVQNDVLETAKLEGRAEGRAEEREEGREEGKTEVITDIPLATIRNYLDLGKFLYQPDADLNIMLAEASESPPESTQI